MDTIFALASAPGRAGISVIRLSGLEAITAVELITRSELKGPKPKLRTVYNQDGSFVDEALILIFSEPYSFTGENVAEIHLHGSQAVVASTIKILNNISGLRKAEAGEFTRRSLDNGKLDLAQVEGLGDLIDAETEAQLKQAGRVFTGALGKKSNDWREKLTRAAALLVATIDFADEEVPEDVSSEVETLINTVAN